MAWKLYIEPYHRPHQLATFEFFHPTFLYESVWDLAVFGILYFLLRRRLEQTPGALVLCYLGLYSFGRFFIEALRIDSLMLGPIRVAQAVSFALMVASLLGLLWLRFIRRRPERR